VTGMALLAETDPLASIRWLLLATAALAALAHLFWTGGKPHPAKPWIKGWGAAALGLFALTALDHQDPAPLALIGAGLILGSLGDILLALTPRRFTAGLAAFLAGHLAYAGAFALAIPPAPAPAQGMAAMAVMLAAYLLWRWLKPDLGRHRGAVAAYVGVITAMTVLAMLANLPLAAAAGALLFMLSDALLAVREFKTAFRFAHQAVWLTYGAAQALIALSFTGFF